MATDIISQQEFESINLFKGTEFSELTAFLDKSRRMNFETGDILLKPEISNTFVHFLLSGSMSIHLESPESEAVAVVKPGESLGELSVFDGRNPSAYVKASEGSQTLCIENHVVWDMINHSHALSRNFLFLLAKRLRTGNETVSSSRLREQEHLTAAFTDSLTSLNNRRWINEKLFTLDGPELLDMMPFSVIMSDVDHFKNFNDTYGHRAGDLVLMMVGECLKANTRPTDYVARYGGEEFMVVLPKTPPHVAENVANKLREKISEQTVLDDDGKTLPQVTISMGLCIYKEGIAVKDMVENADAALYQAKDAGRNCVITYKADK